MTEDEEGQLRADVRHRLAGYLLEQTRSAVYELFPTVPERWGGGQSATETLGLPVLPQACLDIVYAELHRIAVRVMNPASVFTDEAIDDRIQDEELKEKT